MVQHEGARIAISGSPPASAPFAVARNHRSRAYETASYDDGSGYVMPRRSRIYAAPVYSSPVYGYEGYDYGQPVYPGYGASSPFPF